MLWLDLALDVDLFERSCFGRFEDRICFAGLKPDLAVSLLEHFVGAVLHDEFGSLFVTLKR